MRIVLPCSVFLLAGLNGCARPVAVEVPVVADVTVAAHMPERESQLAVAPMPREITDDPKGRRARTESYRKDEDSVLRDLVRGDIKLGDSIQALAKIYPHYKFDQFGIYATLSRSYGYGGTRLLAKDGKLVCASTSSCVYYDEFFKDMTEKEWDAWSEAYYAEIRKKNAPRPATPMAPLDDTILPPREVKKPVP